MSQNAKIALSACLTLFVGCGGALAQSYDLSLTDASGIDGGITAELNNDGTLVGDWDPETNPTGTRTKPGIFGSFGATENVPVPTTVDLTLGGPVSASSGGSFAVFMNAAELDAVFSGMILDLIGSEPIALPAEVSLLFSSFRTRSPDSTFIGGFPITLPLGELSLVALRFTQGEAALAELTPIGPGRYGFVVAIPGEISGVIDALGGEFELPATPIILPLTGTIEVDGDSILLAAGTAIEQSVVQEPMTALPPIPLPLPTILPAGETANTILDLVLETVAFDLAADIVLEALGSSSVCVADCDGDGQLTLFDFLCFQNNFALGLDSADCDGDGALTLFDFLCFQNSFAIGCG